MIHMMMKCVNILIDKMAKKLPRIISQEEFEKLHDAAIKIEKSSGKKRSKRIRQYRLAMILGFEAGMRISEIVGYESKQNEIKYWKIKPLNQTQIEGNSIKVIGGKGGKDRMVPKPKRINQRAIDMLPLTISRRSLQSFITKLGKNVLNKEMSFHTLRHGFVTHLVNQGRPLHEVQMLAGHSRLDTTGIYLHANPTKAIEGARDSF